MSRTVPTPMNSDLDALIAHSLDADPRLLPLLPELLADLTELGTFAEQIVTVLRDAGLERDAAAADGVR
jgi:hypothetical protein